MPSHELRPPASLSHAPGRSAISRRVALGRAGIVLAASAALLSSRQITAAPLPALAAPPAPAFADVVPPTDGELRFDPGETSYQRRQFPLDLTDCVLSSTFRNPFAAANSMSTGANGTFSYGFRFRTVGERGVAVYVTGSGFWVRTAYDDKGVADDATQLFGALSGLRLGASDANDLRVVVTGDVGELFVNGTSVAAFLLDRVESGGVEVITDLVTSKANVMEAATRYERFTVTSPPPPLSMRAQTARSAFYGPTDGGIPHDPDEDTIKRKGTGLQGIRDATVRARFFVPYSDPNIGWDCGYVVRSTTTRQLRVAVVNNREYILTVGTRPDENADWDFKDGQRGPISGLRVGLREFNDVEFTMNGAVGKLTVNGTVINDRLTLTGVPDPGTVGIATSLRTGTERRGATTHYENFTVAPLP